ncbi:retropepsin-like aspartic protease family protein [Phenylobacterium aquaticum]|uniref:retropepsin-like aspartic protease family protein n=1 Tax=Phenylobacterium aquaticum TaxID=1763816 RepID=UPI001F5C9644|nr:TIGR02281 family clan AA aspartic protease [Phenylobacterium aquaticum]MCI3133925.1 TIGR02281 family clan AA aspartic protease [Phenylobacterium aquaticum]
MTDDGGPWGRPRPEAPKPAPSRPPIPRQRLLIWVGVMVATGAAVWGLARANPGAVSSEEDWMWTARSVAIVALLSSALLRGGPIRWGEKARHAAMWVAVGMVLILGYSYRGELAGLGQRLQGELTGAHPVAAGDHELVVSREQGGFFVIGQVNGQTVRFMVDTGATDTVLSPADARRLGLDTAKLVYGRPAQTANGLGFGADFKADSLAIGPIRMTDMPMVVNQTAMDSSLLGMSFLTKLESFQVKGDRLYLRWRG